MSLDGEMGESICAVHRERRNEQKGYFSANKAREKSTAEHLQTTQSSYVNDSISHSLRPASAERVTEKSPALMQKRMYV